MCERACYTERGRAIERVYVLERDKEKSNESAIYTSGKSKNGQ